MKNIPCRIKTHSSNKSENFFDFYSFVYDISFVRENIDKMKPYDWYMISHTHELDMDFIQTYEDKLVLDALCRFQNLSEEFIRKNISLININDLKVNKNIDEKIIEEIKLLKDII
jgi:hypothetical protein